MLLLYRCLYYCRFFCRCVIVEAQEARDEDVALVHTQDHINFIRSETKEQDGERYERNIDKDVYFNDFSCISAYVAAGAVIEV